MAEEIAFENGRISNFQGLVTLDRVILHTAGHHSSTYTYMQARQTSCRLQSNYSSMVTLHGGPVVLLPVRATLLLYPVIMMTMMMLMCHILTFDGILESDLGCSSRSSIHGRHHRPGSTTTTTLFHLSASISRKTPSVSHRTAIHRQPLCRTCWHSRLRGAWSTIHR